MQLEVKETLLSILSQGKVPKALCKANPPSDTSGKSRWAHQLDRAEPPQGIYIPRQGLCLKDRGKTCSSGIPVLIFCYVADVLLPALGRLRIVSYNCHGFLLICKVIQHEDDFLCL